MATDFTSQITAIYQAVEYRNPPAAELAVYNAALQSGTMTIAQVQSAVINDPFTSTVVDAVIREYQAAFNRVPDQAGVSYWVNAIATNPAVLPQLNTIFANSAEFTARFGATATTPANPALVTALYTNVYGRAPDQAGLNYWSTSGLNASQLLQAFANAQEFVTMTTPAIQAFQQLEIAGTAPATGSLFAVAPNATTGVTLSLTQGVDVLNGTGFNDVFIGDQTAAVPTVSAGDQLNGGAGVDTFKYFNAAGTDLSTIVLPQMNSIEVLELDGGTLKGGSTLDVSGVAGLTNVNVVNPKAMLAGDTFTIKSASGTNVGLTNVNSTNTKGDVSAVSLNGATGATLNGVGTTAGTLKLDVANATGSTFTITDTGAASTVTLSNSGGTLTSLVLNGDKQLTLNDTVTTITTIDASADTGGVKVTFGTPAAGKTVTALGGSGNDTFDMSNVTNADVVSVKLGAGNDVLKVGANLATWTAGTTLDGGTGTDVINITDGATLTKTTAALLTGFETLDISGAVAKVAPAVNTYDLSLGGFTKVQIDASVSGALNGAVALTNLPSTGFALDILSAKGTDFAVGNDVTFTLKDATGKADSLAINLTSVDGNNDGVAQGNITTGVMHLAGTETLTINATTTTADSGVSANKYIETTTLEDLSATLQTLVITGNESVVVNGTNAGVLGSTTLGSLTKIDASASTSDITIDYHFAPKAVTYLGSAGVDTITTSDGGTVYGAGGNDVITLTAATTTPGVGGAAATYTGINADTIVYKSASDATVKVLGSNVDATTKFETINNFTTTNSGDVNHAHDTIDLSPLGGFTGYARGAMTITGVNPASGTFAANQTNFFNDGIGNRGVVLDVVGGNTYVFVDANHDGNFTAGSDLVIKLAGVTNMTATDFNFG